jgi:hypothetical protein
MVRRISLKTQQEACVFGVSAAALWSFRYVCQLQQRPLDSRGWAVRSRLLEGLEHAVQVAADCGHAWVVGAKGRLADLKRPLQLGPSAFQVANVPQQGAEVV